MTTTTINHEATYKAGQEEAVTQLGLAEVRPIDETLFGLRAVLKAGGQDYSIMDIFNRYHSPFVFSHDKMSLAELTTNIVGAARSDILKRYTQRYENESHDRCYVIRHAWEAVKLWNFRSQVMQLIENDLKKHDRTLRKNSKQFKRLSQMVFAEAQMQILREMSNSLNRQIGSLKQHLKEEEPGTIAQDALKLKNAAQFLISSADDLDILQPGEDVRDELLALAGKFETKASSMLPAISQAITDMEQVATSIDQALVELGKADVARRAWARTLKEADDRGLKGVGRQQFETEAAFSMQKAECLQLAVDKILCNENLLKEGEGMVCVF
jgi:hypothetical protein